MGSRQSSGSTSTEDTSFTTPDLAMHFYATKFKSYEDGKKILMKLRTQLIRIIKQKLKSDSKALDGINNLDLNIYVDDNVASCKIGDGGILLIINIIGDKMDYEWNDTSGIIEEMSSEDINQIKFAFAA